MQPADAITRQRHQARDRKRRQRERRQSRNHSAALAEAERIEREGIAFEAMSESLAPRVVREEIRAPDGRLIRGPLVQIIDGRPVLSALADPIAISQKFTSRQKRAAHLLQLDWRTVGAGINAGAVDYLRSGGGGASGSNLAIINQIVIRERLDGAFNAAGAFGPGLARVVLDCVSLAHWAETVGKAPDEAAAWIAAGLDRLVAFYWPPAPDS